MGKSLIRAAAAALVLSVLSFAAQAAGLGRLTVLSSLGQPFRGEIDLVSVKKEELSSLTARIASPDAFRQADLPFTAYVSTLKLAVEKRPNGDPFVKVSASQPLNEPFIDFLIELSWTSGRLVRSYTALVDPPVVTDEKTDVAQAEAKPETPAPAAEPAPAPKPAEPASEVKAAPSQPPAVEAAPLPAEPKPEPAPAAVTDSAAAPAPAPKAASQEPTGDYKVKRGDTLGKIARANKPADISLEQMLVLLYRDNPDAFDGKNMNRLRAGRVLRMPDASEAASVSDEDAKKEVRVQAANWNAYREKLAAAAPSLEEAPGRSSGGKVTTKVEEKAAPLLEPPKEVLKLSKGEAAKAGGAAAPAKEGKSQEQVRALEEEVASKSKAVADANERIAQLEKQIKDMQALVEMKSKGMAELQKGGAKPPTPAPAEKPVPKLEPTTPTPMKGEPGPPLKPDAKGAAPDLVPPKAGPAPTPEPAKPPVVAEAPKPPEAASPPPEPPKPPKKKFIPPPPPPPPSLVDQILGEPLYLAGGGAVLALLGGLGYMRWKRGRGGKGGKADPEDYSDGGVGAAAATALAAGAAAEDERQGGGDTGVESDPLAEAEVFLIYGRDAQAEERLKEAIAATPTRYELHAKLLEIYAKRGDALSFEPVAKDLQMGTGGQGELWEKAVRLGYQLDPGNPRYLAGKPADEDNDRTFPGAEATVQMDAMPSGGESRSDLDFNLGFDESPSNVSTDIDLGELGQQLEQEAATKTDIDLGELSGTASQLDDIVDPTRTMAMSADDTTPTMQMAAFDPTANLAAPDTGDLPTLPGIPPGAAAAAADDLGLDFDLGDATKDTADKPLDGGDDDLGGISFDLNTLKLDSPPLEQPAAAPSVPDLDLGGLSLELDQPGSPPEAPAGKDEKWYDVQTKFDLAKAYQEMGDKEGAREILQEVLADGDAEQKGAAQSLLDSLG